MTEEEKDAELVSWMSKRYDLERVLVLAENSESTDAIILAAEIRRLRGVVQALEDK